MYPNIPNTLRSSLASTKAVQPPEKAFSKLTPSYYVGGRPKYLLNMSLGVFKC